jgi:hypothetical protein
MVTVHDPAEPVTQLVAERVPPVVVKEIVTPCALFVSWAVMVEVVIESAGSAVGLAESVTAGMVSVVDPEL